MRVKFKRPRGFNTQGRKAERDMKNYVTTRLILGLTQFHAALMDTPVYTGRTLVNFRWNIGSPALGTRAAVKRPALPGKTSNLSIGSEPRRAANTSLINEEFAVVLLAVRTNPFQDIFLNNNLEHFSDVEYGVYAREGKDSRTPPGGMTRRGEVALEAAMGRVLKRVS